MLLFFYFGNSLKNEYFLIFSQMCKTRIVKVFMPEQKNCFENTVPFLTVNRAEFAISLLFSSDIKFLNTN